jgi:hypothetical protein
MSAKTRIVSRLLFALAAVFLITCLVSQAQPPESAKKSADGKTVPSGLPIIKLPDGSYILTGSSGDSGEQAMIPLQELQKIQEKLDQQSKQIAALQKASAPSECEIRGRIEKRGEQPVAVLKITYRFQTSLPQMISLGGKKGFLVSANLDGKKLPTLEPIDDGVAARIETAGEHTLTIDLDAPITARSTNAKSDLGFEIGLPRSPITTFALEPSPDIKRVTLATRVPDSLQPNKPLERRLIDVKSLASRPGQEKGYTLGPTETLEVTWEPPAAAAQPAVDQIQSAELDLSTLFTEAAVESTVKIKLHGPAREWRLIAPLSAELSVDRATSSAEVGPSQLPAITKPGDPNKPVWKIEIPVGSSASDWVITAVTRQFRAKTDDPKHKGPFPIGPFTVLDVLRQNGTVRVTAGPHTHFTFKLSADLRQSQSPTPGPAEDEVSTAFFRLATGPTGTTVPNQPQPLFTVEASPQVGSIVIKPTYKFTLVKDPLSDEVDWRIQAEIRVSPHHMTVNELAIEIPVEWEGVQSESVSGVALGSKADGFWSLLAAKLAKGTRVQTILYLPAGQKQAFDLVLKAAVRVPLGANKITIPLLRFPGATERGVNVTATVPEGMEIREGEARSGDGDSVPNRGITLNPLPAQSGKAPKTITSVGGEGEASLSQAILGWSAARPDMTADIVADVVLSDRQIEITEQIKLRSVDGFPRSIRIHSLHNDAVIAGLKSKLTPQAVGPIHPSHAGGWTLSVPPDVREILLEVNYAVALDRRLAEQASWNLSIPLLAPVGATHTDTAVRIWSNTTSPRKISNSSREWRELPVEVVPNRDTIPSLFIASSSGESPLSPVVEVRETSEASNVNIWVDRTLIQAWGTDDGSTHYRARLHLRKWLAPSLEIKLPGLIAGTNPEFLLDGSKVMDVTIVKENQGTDREFRIRLPGLYPGKSLTVEILYQLPTSWDELRQVVYSPPLLANASYASPARWQITVPSGTVPLLTTGAIPEFHWHWGVLGFAPIANEQSNDEPPNVKGDVVTARQLTPGPIAVYRFAHIPFVVVCSVLLFAVIFLLPRLPVGALGLVIAVLGCVAGILALLLPHAAAQVAGASQPGVAFAIAVLLGLAAIRSYYRHRITHLPGFTRMPIEPSGTSAPVPSSARNRPSGIGSAGAVPVAPAGG